MPKLFSKAYKISIVVLLLPLTLFAQVNNVTCSRSGYTIEVINGINTTEKEAKDNRQALNDHLLPVYNGEKVTIDYLYNPTHGLIDFSDVAIQKTFSGVDMKDPDFIKIINSASTQVKTQKLLLVAHSQGNLYANNFYKAVTDSGDVSTKSIGVYSVATPASYVAGDGIYRTSDTDIVINLARKFLPGGTLPAHDSIDYLESDDSGRGHSFRGVYLQYRAEEIKKEIEKSLSKLFVDTNHSDSSSCITPPANLSIREKIVRKVVYPADLVIATSAVGLTVVKEVVVATANTVVNIAITVYGVATKALSTSSSSANNTASVILATEDALAAQTNTLNGAGESLQTSAEGTNQSFLEAPYQAPTSDETPTQTNTPTDTTAPATPSDTVITTASTTATTETSNSAALTFGGGSSTVSSQTETATTTNETATSTDETATTTTQLSAPTLSVPQCDDSLATSTDSCLLATTTVRFEWDTVDGALYYAINQNAASATTTATSTDILAEDFSDFTFEISAIGASEQSSATSTKTVSIATVPIAINEVAWMGTIASTNDEWIELKNNTAYSIDLSTWTLSTADGAPAVALTGTIAPHEYRVLERRASTATSVNEGQVYGNGSAMWALGNSGEQLVLSYASTTIDQTPEGAWVAGYNSTSEKRTMERISAIVSGVTTSNWLTNNGIIKNGTDALGNAIGGTPGAENSASIPRDADVVAPIITMNGDNPATVLAGSVYFDAGATAVDDVDGSRAVITTSNVDTSHVGAYTVIYTASDLSSNTATSTRTVDVINVAEPITTVRSSDINTNGIDDADETDVIVTISRSLIPGEYHFHNLTITNNATLFAEGDATITSSEYFSGVKIIADNITVSSGSSISSDGRGYVASGPGTGGNWGAYGASYGGAGGGNTESSVYGSAMRPVNLGSGVPTSYHGGGAIRLVVSGALSNDGIISANGGGSRTSGGSIYVTTNTLTGTGVFKANGSDTSWPYSYAGGGGRIAIYYGQSTFSGNAEAIAGRYCNSGCNASGNPGTVAFFDTTNNDFYPGRSWRFQKNDGSLNFNRIIIANGASVTMEEDAIVRANELVVGPASSLTLSKGSLVTVPKITLDSGTLLLSGEETLTVDDVTLTGTANFTVARERVLALSLKNLTVGSGATVSANGKGYGTTGPGSSDWSKAASYGGIGGMNTASSLYGSATTPTDLGSGTTGGGYYGGGAMRIVVSDTFENNGIVSANGAWARTSGGSIYVTTNILTGAGTFSANGGGTGWPEMYAGGGGRIAIYYTQSTFSGSARADAGILCFYGCNPAGDAGTVAFVDTTTNDLYPGHSWRFQKNDEPLNFNRIIIANGASVTMEEGVALSANELIVRAASSITLSKGSLITVPKITLDGGTLVLSGEETLTTQDVTLSGTANITVARERVLSLSMNNLTIGSGSTINANLKGSGPRSGPGGSSSNAGASYGGVGLWGVASSTYGSEREPVDFGSGGNGYNPYGGGAIRIVTTDSLTNNGSISANGGDTSSGGSIYVTTNNLAGSGEFRADGGSTYCPYSCVGSGGGGRIAIYYQNSSFTGGAFAAGKSNYYGTSGNGTVVSEVIVDEPAEIIPPPTPPVTPPALLNAEHSIVSFSTTVATSTIAGVIDESAYAVSLTVPFGTDVRALIPTIVVSSSASLAPSSGIAQDFTNPVVYMITAEDGSDQPYTVTVTVTSDTEAPSIMSYTFNSVVGDYVADFSTTTPTASFELTARENVDWVSLKIESQENPDHYKTFFSGDGCVDGTTTCLKSWDGTLSDDTNAPDGMYRIKAHIRDSAGNEYNDYLSPFVITVTRYVSILEDPI